MMLGRFLRPLGPLRPSSRILHAPSAPSNHYTTTPTVIQSSFWLNMVPKPLRRTPPSPALERSRAWNPSTFFIVMFLLIGSNAIQMIALQKDVATFTRRADAKLGLLKEIVDRLQRGDAVDVARLLGTGDRRQEQEWDAVIHEIENNPSLAATQENLHRGTSGPSPAVCEQKMLSSSHAIVEEAEVGKAPPGFF